MHFMAYLAKIYIMYSRF